MNGTIEPTLVYIDTYVLIEIFERPGVRADRLGLLMEIGSEERSLIVSDLSFAEIMIKPLRDNDQHLTLLYVELFMLETLFKPKRVSQKVLHGAAQLRAGRRRVTLPDAIHLSTAAIFHASHFLSLDEGLRNIDWEPLADAIAMGPDFIPPAYLHPDDPLCEQLATHL